jgi:hypothetical protein
MKASESANCCCIVNGGPRPALFLGDWLERECKSIAGEEMKKHTARPNGFDQSDCPYVAGESIPHSGLYEICHQDEPRTQAILTLQSVFPFCRSCGERVRYKLLQAVPHISEDPDFNEFFTGSYNPAEDSAAPNRVLPRQLGLAYGFRFWQENMQAWRDSADAGDL